MAHAVLKFNKEKINEIKKHYQNALINKSAPGALFTAKTPDYTITAYQSGKVLFQGKNAELEAAKWQAGNNQDAPSKKSAAAYSAPHQYLPPKNISDLTIIGSDEVGTGDYFGPITVCAVHSGPEQHDILEQLGVKDSKSLTDERMIMIARDLIKHVDYSLLILPNDKYNQLQSRGYSQGKMKAILHNQAILHVIDKLKAKNKAYDAVLIDQFAKPDLYFSYIKDEKQQARDKVFFQTKAEGLHLSVAAASIIARYAFLKEMDKLSELAGQKLPKGAGYKVDEAAADIIRKKGEGFLKNIAKIHFANTKKAQKLK
ncbi:ribonuclease HIII [Scopulibacillus daqui]|uniref:Ribonuclease HIII n=1 Tax=Scopulibacillus daqui TaxID=1469162 RepID=A0ABS2PZR6_9BACL|nr:ribonuclease HIII [Scopulibacillus daqui]MBM7644767.1 ribonuclease HIII [Scopulibacillus daqui]